MSILSRRSSDRPTCTTVFFTKPRRPSSPKIPPQSLKPSEAVLAKNTTKPGVSFFLKKSGSWAVDKWVELAPKCFADLECEDDLVPLIITNVLILTTFACLFKSRRERQGY